jgi:hypothetical protein
MEKADFAELRVMLLSGKTHGAQTLRSVLTLAGINKILTVEQPSRAIDLLTMEYFDAIFAAEGCDPVDGLTFPLAALHGGAVAIESAPGEGTCVSVRLPQAGVDVGLPEKPVQRFAAAS